MLANTIIDGENACVLPCPIIRQPNWLTCGPSSLLAAHIGASSRPIDVHDDFAEEVLALAEKMGTCPEYGTRHIEMEKGLEVLGWPVNRGVPNVSVQDDGSAGSLIDAIVALSYLYKWVAAGNYVILRTLWHGCKHWVLVVGYTHNQDFVVMEPASGKLMIVERKRLGDFWGLRGYDCFTIPAQRLT